MRARGSIAFLLFALVMAACTNASTPLKRAVVRSPHERSPASAAPADLLVLGSGTTVASLDPRTGSLVFEGAAVPALSDWSQLFSTTRSGGWTTLEERAAVTGIVATTRRLKGDLAIRAVSADGQEVALMAPLPKGTTAWIPRPRAFTDLVVADPSGVRPATRFHLKGNFEPEAFSSDGSALFLIRYLPALAPTSYRVVHLDLADKDVYPVEGRAKTWQPKMAGTRLMQVPSGNASRLYTLYSSQPPSYARGYDSAQSRASKPVAFVHTLSLDEGWALCVGLPKSLWGGRPADEAMAVSPDGASVYVVDTARGVVAEMDTSGLEVAHTATVDFSTLGRGRTSATVSPDGSELYVARGSSVMTLDAIGFAVRDAWRLSGSVSGLGFSADGRRLYAAMPGHVALLDPATGEPTQMIASPDIAGLEYVAALTP
jgi:hypothetical protein